MPVPAWVIVVPIGGGRERKTGGLLSEEATHLVYELVTESDTHINELVGGDVLSLEALTERLDAKVGEEWELHIDQILDAILIHIANG
jgi:hypothetical protein